MAEIEKEQIIVENGETVIVEREWNVIPPNRPRKVYAGMWGSPEIGVVAAGGLAVLMALVAYFFWVVPSNAELAKNRAEADRLEAELISAKTKYGEITNVETQVAKIVESIDDFEARFLPVTTTGQAALYQRMNGLIAAYGLVNTTGPDYAPLEAADLNQPGEQSGEEKGRTKFRSLYPGVYVSTTVEGSYQNLRRFIREIETGREFIVVSAVELAPSDTDKRKDKQKTNTVDDQGNPSAAVRPTNPTFGTDPRGFPGAPVTTQNQTQSSAKQEGKTHGETVSLHIELAAYFRRPSVAAAR
jgi:Tfp pilus assembly protein PilO